MDSLRQTSHSEAPEKFGIEDCEALLQFPYHDYAVDVKSEINSEPDSSLPDDSLNSNSSGFPHHISKTESTDNDTCSSQEKCLALNQAIQMKMRETLNQLGIALQENLAKQDELIEAAKEDMKSLTDGVVRYAKPISLFAAPYFRDVRGMVPPDNEDTIAKSKKKDVTAYHQPPKPWTKIEKDQLIEGVAASALSVVLKPYKIKRDYLKSKLKNKNLLQFELDILKKQIQRVESEIQNISQRPLPELIEETKESLDWLTISATNLQGNKSEEECEMMWNNYLSNQVNKEPFSAEEDKKLFSLIRKYAGRNWDFIAKELKTNRTAIQCFERYQTDLNPELTKKYWTPEEDKQLIHVVNSVKIGSYIPWNKVCCYMEGRKRDQIINRYERTVNEKIKRTPFTTEEDAMLMACCRKFGLRWTKMKELLPGRPCYTIRERFVNTLDSTLKIGNWSKAEDIKLIALLDKYGYGRWSKIAREMPGRTDNMCLVRAQRLVRHTKRLYKRDPSQRPKNGLLVLKPQAPSKSCTTQNRRLKFIQDSAMHTLKLALEKIQPYVDDKINTTTLDLSLVSVNTMRVLQKELLSKESENSYADKWIPHYVLPEFQTGPVRRKMPLKDIEDYISSESEDAEETKNSSENGKDNFGVLKDEDISEDNSEDEKFLDEGKKAWLFDVLHQRMREEGLLIPSSMKTSPICLSVRESAECAFYRSYLRKKFLYKAMPEEEDWNSSENLDYKTTLSDVIRYFIEPELNENEPVVLCPNFATMNAMEVIEVTKPRLRRTAGFIDQSESYLQYLVGQTETRPKCTKCKEENPNATDEFFAAYLQAMYKKLLVVDDSFKKAAGVEIGFPSEECKCKELAKSRKDFNLLQKRFLSLFLWPSLLSATDLNMQQAKLLGRNVSNNYNIAKSPTQSRPGVKRKVGRPKKIKEEIIIPVKRACLDELASEGPSQELPESSEGYTEMKNTQNKGAPIESAESPTLRRSQRRCTLQRKSYTFPEGT